MIHDTDEWPREVDRGDSRLLGRRHDPVILTTSHGDAPIEDAVAFSLRLAAAS